MTSAFIPSNPVYVLHLAQSAPSEQVSPPRYDRRPWSLYESKPQLNVCVKSPRVTSSAVDTCPAAFICYPLEINWCHILLVWCTLVFHNSLFDEAWAALLFDINLNIIITVQGAATRTDMMAIMELGWRPILTGVRREASNRRISQKPNVAKVRTTYTTGQVFTSFIVISISTQW